MPRSQHYRTRISQAARICALLAISLSTSVLAVSTTTATTTPISMTIEEPQHHHQEKEEDWHSLLRRQDSGAEEMPVGAACPDDEGQWNCMDTSFQRCGSALWSPVQQCALGTRCSPSGRTYQFHVDFADGYLGAAPPPPPSSSSSSLSLGLGGMSGWPLRGSMLRGGFVAVAFVVGLAMT